MNFIVDKLLLGQSPSMVVRHKDFASWTQKVRGLKEKAERIKAERARAKAQKGVPS